MEIVSEEISTRISTMAIENTEEGTLRPVFAFLAWRLHDIKNYGNSVLIVVSNYSLVGVSCITRNYSVFPNRAFGLLEIW